jgi:glucose/arabinose dehydrogenase
MPRRVGQIAIAIGVICIGGAATFAADPPRLLTGQAAYGDWKADAPGVRRKITAADVPAPYATPAVRETARVIAQPPDARLSVPAGFSVTLFADHLEAPRAIRVAPNGDIFVAESRAGRVRVLRAADGAAKPDQNEVFASGLDQPFGIAFYPPGPDPHFVYVATTGSVVRFPYNSGDLKAGGPVETIVPDLVASGGGHWTRDVAFSADGKRMFVSVGSRSNVDDDENEKRRADILVFNPEGKDEKVYASGIRNPVGLAIQPDTGEVWASVNERDGLGDDLVPDYVTHVQEGGFYGWPWYYIGPHLDPRHQGKHPELKDRAIVPDVLLQAHSASLCMTFYTGSQFPKDFWKDAFAAEHGSWNRSRRTGYKVIRIPMKDGKATGEYEDFLVGFVTKEGEVWGRPVGVAVAKDGALLVTDDGSGTIWRVGRTREK